MNDAVLLCDFINCLRNLFTTGNVRKKQKHRHLYRCFCGGDPKENRTPDSALRGQRLNRLTIRPDIRLKRRKRNDITGLQSPQVPKRTNC